MSSKHELLIPAGSYEKAVYAIKYGADAIYIGPKAYSLRARSSNFNIAEIQKVVNLAHQYNKKVYVALNIICHNSDLKGFESYFKKINECNIDGVIVADPFIVESIHKINPNMEIHISTQQSVTNSKACLFWKNNHATRIVLGREVSGDELKQTLDALNDSIEIEYFIHGAVCISYSGRCMMSNNFSLRDANVGGCAQSCRWKYKIVNNNNYGCNKSFTMSAKDMSLLNDMDKLLKLNVASFKVEGRMKSIHYVATIANCYRKVIDCLNNNIDVDINEVYKELKKAENRLTENAWFDGNPNIKKMLYTDHEENINQIFAFNFEKIIAPNVFEITSRNHFSKDFDFEIVRPNINNESFKILKILDEKKNEIDVVKTPMKKYLIYVDKRLDCSPNTIARITMN